MQDDYQLNIILLLDNKSKEKIKRDITELDKSGVTIIEDLRELSQATLKKTRKVVLLDSFLLNNNALSDLKLFKTLFNLEYYFVGTDPHWLNIMDNYAKCFNMDIELLDYDILYSIVVGDKGMQERFLNLDEPTSDVEDFINRIKDDYSVPEEFRELAVICSNLLEINRNVNEISKSSSEVLEGKESKYKAEHDTLDELLKSYSEVIKRSSIINKNLKQYERILTKDIYEPIDITHYRNRPTVIYLKEYQEIIHMESLLDTLCETLRLQNRKTCKVLRLYDSSASKRIENLPKKYTMLRNEFTNKEFNCSDFIAKVGDHKDVVKLLLENAVGTDIVFIVDCKDHNQVVTLGHDLVFYLCRNEKNLSKFDLDEINTIVNNSNSKPLSWDTYERYSKFKNKVDRFNYLSSRPIIQEIVSTIELKMNGGM